MFLTCWTSYEVEHQGTVEQFNAARSGDRVLIPLRRIALLRQCGTFRVTVVETVNGRCYYLPGMPDDVARMIEHRENGL